VVAVTCVVLGAVGAGRCLSESLGYINEAVKPATGPVFYSSDGLTCCDQTVLVLDCSIETLFNTPRPNQCDVSPLLAMPYSTVSLKNQEGVGTLDIPSRGQSYIDNSSFNYHHLAYDYRLPGIPSGCSSCGGGGALEATKLPKLTIERSTETTSRSSRCSIRSKTGR
jgi:hypothetical protein